MGRAAGETGTSGARQAYVCKGVSCRPNAGGLLQGGCACAADRDAVARVVELLKSLSRCASRARGTMVNDAL